MQAAHLWRLWQVSDEHVGQSNVATQVGQKDDSDAILAAANIIGSLGSNFRVEDRYTRLYILMSKGNFEMLLQR
ncbi:tryptophan aminotransferase-related protein 3-like protein, partial [Tanacetum coccineum]